MKRSDIRNAYDAMNPTPQQRDQMYRAVMQKAGKMNGRYQAQPTKQHKWAWHSLFPLFVLTRLAVGFGKEGSLP